MDIYIFFYEALPEVGEMTLPELHSIVGDVWLTRYDEELEEERRIRRKGRPKSVKEVKLEELRLREAEVYRTGMGDYHYSSSPSGNLMCCLCRSSRSYSSPDRRTFPPLGPKRNRVHPTPAFPAYFQCSTGCSARVAAREALLGPRPF